MTIDFLAIESEFARRSSKLSRAMSDCVDCSSSARAMPVWRNVRQFNTLNAASFFPLRVDIVFGAATIGYTKASGRGCAKEGLALIRAEQLLV